MYDACSGCVVGLSWGDMDSCRDVPQYKVMKYLVFGIISSSLLSELHVMIPITKLFALGGGGGWRTCAMRDDVVIGGWFRLSHSHQRYKESL